MAPPVTVTALLIILALVPGWVYLRLVERLRPRPVDNPLNQFLEVLAVGAGTTGVSALVVTLLPHRWLPITLDVDAWAAGGPKYLREHWQQGATTAAVVFALATLIAVGLYRLRALRQPPEFVSYANWVQSFGERPSNMAAYVGLHLEDGRLVEGELCSYSLDEDPTKRDVTLAKPIRITADKAAEAQWLLNIDRLIVPAGKIAFITVVHVPGRVKPKRSR